MLDVSCKTFQTLEASLIENEIYDPGYRLENILSMHDLLLARVVT